MRKNFGAKPLSYPQPVLIVAAYDENGTPNAMNAAWGGISDSEEISMCLSSGIVSGNRVPDKLAKSGFHTTKSAFVNAPLIDELPIALECRLKDYKPETGMMRGEIVNVSVDERVLDENGNVDPAKASPITFDPFNNTYLRLGEKVGNAFSDGKRIK